MEDDWEMWVHDVQSGAPVSRVESADSSWSTSITRDGASTETVVVNDAEAPWAQGEVAAMFTPNDRMLVRWWGGFPMYAHKIEDWDYDRDAGTVTATAVDVAGETGWRLVAPTFGGPPLVVSNRTASGAVAAALARMMAPGPNWVFPIDLPSDAAGDFSGQWEFWKKYRISDIITQIEDTAGVETFLRPYAVAGGGVRLQTRVAPKVTVGASSFNLDAEESPLAGVHYRVDGKRQITGLLGLGNGFGEDQETAWQGNVIRGIPIRDTKQSFPDLTGAALQQATSAYYQVNTWPVVQWSVKSFTIGNGWTPEHAAPGRVWNLESHGDPVIPDGVHQVRVIKVSGGNGRVLNMEVQDAAA